MSQTNKSEQEENVNFVKEEWIGVENAYTLNKTLLSILSFSLPGRDPFSFNFPLRIGSLFDWTKDKRKSTFIFEFFIKNYFNYSIPWNFYHLPLRLFRAPNYL
jgi:hypothetical protein